MRARRSVPTGVLALVAGAMLCAGCATDSQATGRTTRTAAALAPARTLSISCRSPSLGGRLPARVDLPPGYRTTGRRYPVVYFLHGLPAGPQSYTQNAFIAGALLTAHEQAIVVAPQGARDNDSDREYLDWSATENWPRAISADLTSCIDGRFHTIDGRSGRALVGLSAGGYGALNVGLRNLSTFGAVESWSGYFVATDPSGHDVLKLPTDAARRAAAVPRGAQLIGDLHRWPALLAFYVGRADDRFADTNEVFARSLTADRIAHVFRTYPGGHSAALWRSQAPGWLTIALTYLATGRTTLPR